MRALTSNCRFLVEGAFEVATFLLQQGVTSRCARKLSLRSPLDACSAVVTAAQEYMADLEMNKGHIGEAWLAHTVALTKLGICVGQCRPHRRCNSARIWLKLSQHVRAFLIGSDPGLMRLTIPNIEALLKAGAPAEKLVGLPWLVVSRHRCVVWCFVSALRRRQC